MTSDWNWVFARIRKQFHFNCWCFCLIVCTVHVCTNNKFLPSIDAVPMVSFLKKIFCCEPKENRSTSVVCESKPVMCYFALNKWNAASLLGRLCSNDKIPVLFQSDNDSLKNVVFTTDDRSHIYYCTVLCNRAFHWTVSVQFLFRDLCAIRRYHSKKRKVKLLQLSTSVNQRTGICDEGSVL